MQSFVQYKRATQFANSQGRPVEESSNDSSPDGYYHDMRNYNQQTLNAKNMTNPRIQSNDQRGCEKLGATASFEIP